MRFNNLTQFYINFILLIQNCTFGSLGLFCVLLYFRASFPSCLYEEFAAIIVLLVLSVVAAWATLRLARRSFDHHVVEKSL